MRDVADYGCATEPRTRDYQLFMSEPMIRFALLLGFFTSGKLKKLSVNGGVVLTLSDATAPVGASWGSQGMIAFIPTAVGGLEEVSDAGGAPQLLTHLEKGENSQRWPEFLPR